MTEKKSGTNRVSREELAARRHEVSEMLAIGEPNPVIIQEISGRYEISEQQVYKDIRWAKKKLEEIASADVDVERKREILMADVLFKRCIKAGDHAAAASALRIRSTLTGTSSKARARSSTPRDTRTPD